MVRDLPLLVSFVQRQVDEVQSVFVALGFILRGFLSFGGLSCVVEEVS